MNQETQKIDLAQIPDVQIKALIYDEQNKSLLARNNIEALQQELLNRAKAQAEKPIEMKEEAPSVEAPAVDTPEKPEEVKPEANMPRCPHDKSQMKPLGISWVCPRCEYKEIRGDKSAVDELRWRVYFPLQFAWDDFTNTNVTVTSGVASITTGETEGTLISTVITNETRATTRLRDITRAKVEAITASKNNGKFTFSLSNDGGTTWTPLKDNGHKYELNHGNEVAGRGKKQTKYSDLRLRIVMWRETSGSTSPTITSLELSHNYIPDNAQKRIRR